MCFFLLSLVDLRIHCLQAVFFFSFVELRASLSAGGVCFFFLSLVELDDFIGYWEWVFVLSLVDLTETFIGCGECGFFLSR